MIVFDILQHMSSEYSAKFLAEKYSYVLDEEERPDAEVLAQLWLDYDQATNNPPPQDTEIGAIVVPTGDGVERVLAGIRYFVEVWNKQLRNHPILIISGAHSVSAKNPALPAEQIYEIIKKHGSEWELNDEMLKYIIPEKKADNTKQQADNSYEIYHERG